MKKAIILSMLLLASCVTPPKLGEMDVYYDPSEYSLIEFVEKGKVYVSAGKTDKAELYFRKALELAPNSISVLNDLGYVLIEQGRIREALLYLEQGLDLAPNDIALTKNLVRAYFQEGAIEEAHSLLEKILVAHFDQRLTRVGKPTNTELKGGELALLYRNLSIASLMLGYEDEASCFSAMATLFDPSPSQVGQHVRVLLASEQVGLATIILQDIISKSRGNVPAGVMFDYSLALVNSEELATAENGLQRILAWPSLSNEERVEVNILLSAILTETSRDKHAQSLLQQLRDDNQDVCSHNLHQSWNYWPTAAYNKVSQVVTNFCDSLPVDEHELTTTS